MSSNTKIANRDATNAESSTPTTTLLQGDCIELMSKQSEKSVDLIFADPPYFLSNGGMTCKSGKMVSVNKGDWDASRGVSNNHAFNREWLAQCQRLLSDNGSMFVSGTFHVIFSVGFAMQELGFKILNDISWHKVNPPPNLSCRYFTHSTETIIWAAKNKSSKHCFNYADMKLENDGKQMKNLWNIMAPRKAEKLLGKHPTQKPIKLLKRIVSAASQPGDMVLDPFLGSGTTGVACRELGRHFVGMDLDSAYIELAKKRISAVDDLATTAKEIAVSKGSKRPTRTITTAQKSKRTKSTRSKSAA